MTYKILDKKIDIIVTIILRKIEEIKKSALGLNSYNEIASRERAITVVCDFFCIIQYGLLGKINNSFTTDNDHNKITKDERLHLTKKLIIALIKSQTSKLEVSNYAKTVLGQEMRKGEEQIKRRIPHGTNPYTLNAHKPIPTVHSKTAEEEATSFCTFL